MKTKEEKFFTNFQRVVMPTNKQETEFKTGRIISTRNAYKSGLQYLVLFDAGYSRWVNSYKLLEITK
jgi:hypothetical protein